MHVTIFVRNICGTRYPNCDGCMLCTDNHESIFFEEKCFFYLSVFNCYTHYKQISLALLKCYDIVGVTTLSKRDVQRIQRQTRICSLDGLETPHGQSGFLNLLSNIIRDFMQQL